MLTSLEVWFKGIWPFILHGGTGVTLITVLLGAAYFSPVFKKDFIWAAAVVAVLLFAYGVGVHDEAKRRDLREVELVRVVRDAVKKAIESGDPDPYDDPSL